MSREDSVTSATVYGKGTTAAVLSEEAAAAPAVLPTESVVDGIALGDPEIGDSSTDEEPKLIPTTPPPTADVKKLAAQGLELLSKTTAKIIKDPKKIESNIEKYSNFTKVILDENTDETAKNKALEDLIASSKEDPAEKDPVSEALSLFITEIEKEEDKDKKKAKIESLNDILNGLKDTKSQLVPAEDQEAIDEDVKKRGSLIEKFLGITTDDSNPFHELLTEKQSELTEKFKELSQQEAVSAVEEASDAPTNEVEAKKDGPSPAVVESSTATAEGTSAKDSKKEKEPKDPKDKSSITAADTVKSAVAIAAVGTIAGMGFPLLAALVVGAILYYKSTHKAKQDGSSPDEKESEQDRISREAAQGAREAVLAHGKELRNGLTQASERLGEAQDHLSKAAAVANGIEADAPVVDKEGHIDHAADPALAEAASAFKKDGGVAGLEGAEAASSVDTQSGVKSHVKAIQGREGNSQQMTI